MAMFDDVWLTFVRESMTKWAAARGLADSASRIGTNPIVWQLAAWGMVALSNPPGTNSPGRPGGQLVRETA